MEGVKSFENLFRRIGLLRDKKGGDGREVMIYIAFESCIEINSRSSSLKRPSGFQKTLDHYCTGARHGERNDIYKRGDYYHKVIIVPKDKKKHLNCMSVPWQSARI